MTPLPTGVRARSLGELAGVLEKADGIGSLGVCRAIFRPEVGIDRPIPANSQVQIPDNPAAMHLLDGAIAASWDLRGS